MTETNESPATAEPNTSASPDDVPSERPAQLAALDVLLGTWDVQASFAAGFFGPDSPATAMGGGRVSFEWLAGRHFLIQRFDNQNPTMPSGIAVIGAGEGPGLMAQHYYDSRGVARIYHMRLAGGVWKVWRDGAGFFQHFTGTLSPDGTRIDGTWEKSSDGVDWMHDFDLTYIRIAPPSAG
jgi:hypothetical protein